MNVKGREKKRDTYAAIMRAGVRYFGQYGLNTTINLVAEKADVSPETVRAYYATEDLLLEACLSLAAEGFRVDVRQAPTTDFDSLLKLLVTKYRILVRAAGRFKAIDGVPVLDIIATLLIERATRVAGRDNAMTMEEARRYTTYVVRTSLREESISWISGLSERMRSDLHY